MITYGKSYPACSDYDAESRAKELNNHDVYTSSLLVIYALQTLIKEKIVDHRNITILYESDSETQIIDMDSEGNIMYWPPGFCDILDKLFARRFGF